MQAELYGKHGVKSSQVPATPQSSLSGILGQEIRGYAGGFALGKEQAMDKQRQEEIIQALESKVSKNCPRCDWPEFEVIGEAAIPLAAEQGKSWFGPPPTLPVILVSCKNCGFLVQHTRRLLGL
jgi:hypothetical protein